jgi:FMN phosphatase YigB (HAD superfamily)
MLKAVLFDFSQTLVDAANGFRAAEKEAQARIFSDLSLTSWENFLSSYRRIRKEFHEKSMFSRKSLWEEVYFTTAWLPT